MGIAVFRQVGRRWLFVVALQVSSLCAAPARGEIHDRGPTGMVRVVPDTYGTIAEIVMHYDPSVEYSLERTYRDFFSSLSPEVRLQVLCPSADAADEFEMTWQAFLGERDVRIINVGIPISIWARDRAIFRQAASLHGRAASFVPVPDPYYEEMKVNDLIAMDMLGEARFIPAVVNTAVHIEGGNVVSNARHVFVGANLFEENEAVAPDELLAMARRVVGRDLIVVGEESGVAPWGHADMYLTPIDDRTVLVASPRMAEMIIGTGWDAPEFDGTEDDWRSEFCLSDTLQRQFDAAAESLEDLGYRVIRLPALVNPIHDYMVTYNNVIMDRRDGRRILYMPVYDMPHLDLVADAIYRGLGFEVRPVNVADMFTRGGAIRCLFNVSQRRMDDSDCGQDAQDDHPRVFHLALQRQFDDMLERSIRRVSQQRRDTPVGTTRTVR